MLKKILKTSKALLDASHLIPTLLVTSITFLISLIHFSPLQSAQIAIAIFAGQLVVGWSNDLIDYPLDFEASRTNKPLVVNKITQSFLRKSIFIALVFAFVFSLFSPLGLIGTLVHFLGILSATLYNLKLKATAFSPLPYVFSFALLPLAIYLAAGELPPAWLPIAFALFATAFHFLNVLKDLSWDLTQNVHGLPQQIGRKNSIFIAASCISMGLIIIMSYAPSLLES
ncbi:MAG: UbiA family prenyltransferase [Candidatus Nanopelagicales bacterium]